MTRTYAEDHPDNVVLEAEVCFHSHSMTIRWSVQNVGFGEFNCNVGDDGQLRIWNECMGPRFIQHVLNHVVLKAKLMET